MTGNETVRWERLLALLQPIHDRARSTARRLSRSSMDGDDLFQEAVLRAFHKLPALRDAERFGAWFYAVLLSVHRNRGRRPFWRRFVRIDEQQDHEVADVRASDPEHERAQAMRMARALATLPAVQREAVVLHAIDGFSMEEIARMQGVTLSAAKTRVARGRDKLRRHYERRGFSTTVESTLDGEISFDDSPEVTAHG